MPTPAPTAVAAAPPPPPPPPWPDLEVEQPADPRVLVGMAVVAVLLDLATRSGIAVVTGTLLVVAVAAVLLTSGRLTTTHSRAAVAAAPVFALFLTLRTSPWLLVFDIIAAAGLLALGVALARDGSLADLTVPRLLTRAVHLVIHGLAGPGFAARAVRVLIPARAEGGGERGRTASSVARGLLVALPIVLILGLLLASADAVFASFFDVSFDTDDAVAHVVLLVIGGWATAGLLRAASSRPSDGRLPQVRRPLRSIESLIVLGCVIVLYGAFAVAQLVAMSDSGEHVLNTSGLTYAEYARSGFFQLLAVAALTLLILLVLRAVTDLSDDRARRRFVVLAEVAVALTIVIVIVAIHRLNLYQQAYGLTMLRLYSTLFAGWIAVVFLLLSVSLAGVRSEQAWFVPAVMVTGLSLLLGLNIVNPEAAVARSDVAFARDNPHKADVGYLLSLGDDALPTLLGQLDSLPVELQGSILSQVCGPMRFNPPGWASLNTADRAAERARRDTCRSV